MARMTDSHRLAIVEKDNRITALEAEIEQLKISTARADDAAGKGTLAREQAGGMELELSELRAKYETLRNALTEISTTFHGNPRKFRFKQAAETAVAIADKALQATDP